jgi:hypothetical protein
MGEKKKEDTSEAIMMSEIRVELICTVLYSPILLYF